MFSNKHFSKYILQRNYLTKSLYKFFNTSVPAGQPKKVHGGLKDQDRIFTNIYRDGDPFIDGALKRVNISLFREIGTKQKIWFLMALIGSSTKSKNQVLEEEEVLVFHLD